MVSRCGCHLLNLLFHMRSTWHLHCQQALTALHQAGNAVSDSSILTFYRGLEDGKYDNILRETLSVNKDKLTGLFWRALGTGPMDNF